MIIIRIIITIPKSTTNVHIHHFKTTCMCPRSIRGNAGVPFDSAGRFWAYNCTRPVCVSDVIKVLTVLRQDKKQNWFLLFLIVCDVHTCCVFVLDTHIHSHNILQRIF